ncbi:uncharacterized protein [Clytia hemisphaerica]|uniref:Uncharacterized protein n=1 Tax=Clytia hemisphaerica TaxID=252671 RepID=A0A7M5X0A3_9CNID
MKKISMLQNSFLVILIICLTIVIKEYYLPSFIWTNQQHPLLKIIHRSPLYPNKLCLSGYYKNILLLVNFNHPFYDNIPMIRSLYERAFPNMVFYGTKKSRKFNVHKIESHKGYFSYIALADAMEKYTNFTGYLLINDDLLIHPWSLLKLDQNKIWEGPKWPIAVANLSAFDHWYWWNSRWGLKKCLLARQLAMTKYSNLISTLHDPENTTDQRLDCYRGRADIFYVPKHKWKTFSKLSKIFHENNVFLEIAVPTILRMISTSSEREFLDGIYLPGRVNSSVIRDTRYLWSHYQDDLHFIHPVKLRYGDEGTSLNRFVLDTFVKPKFDSILNCTRN